MNSSIIDFPNHQSGSWLAVILYHKHVIMNDNWNSGEDIWGMMFNYSQLNKMSTSVSMLKTTRGYKRLLVE